LAGKNHQDILKRNSKLFGNIQAAHSFKPSETPHISDTQVKGCLLHDTAFALSLQVSWPWSTWGTDPFHTQQLCYQERDTDYIWIWKHEFPVTKRSTVRCVICQLRSTRGDGPWLHQTETSYPTFISTTQQSDTPPPATTETAGGLSFIPTLWDSALLATLSFGKKDWTMSTDITRPTGQRFSSKINVMQKIPNQFEINLSHHSLDGSVCNHNDHAKKLPLKICSSVYSRMQNVTPFALFCPLGLFNPIKWPKSEACALFSTMWFWRGNRWSFDYYKYKALLLYRPGEACGLESIFEPYGSFRLVFAFGSREYSIYSSVPGITYRGRHHQMCPKSIPKSIHTNLVNRNPIVHLSFGDFGGVMQALFLSFWGTTKGCPLFSFEGKSYISKHYIIISFCWNFQFLSFFYPTKSFGALNR